MRARNIKPAIFKNEQLAECSIAARWLFPGLWCLADWKGRLENRPKRIKMEIFPGDSVDVEPLLAELESHGLISTYGESAPGELRPYIWIPKFQKHQSPHQNERVNPSKLPAHPEENGIGTEALREDSGSALDTEPSAHRSNPAESGILNPESGNPEAECSDKSEALPNQPDQAAPIDVFRESWNAMAAKRSLPQCREMTGKRKSEFIARWKDPGWRADHVEALAKIQDSPFLLGKNDRGWKANVEWFLRPDSVTKILEENYGGNRSLSIASPDDSAGLF